MVEESDAAMAKRCNEKSVWSALLHTVSDRRQNQPDRRAKKNEKGSPIFRATPVFEVSQQTSLWLKRFLLMTELAVVLNVVLVLFDHLLR